MKRKQPPRAERRRKIRLEQKGQKRSGAQSFLEHFGLLTVAGVLLLTFGVTILSSFAAVTYAETSSPTTRRVAEVSSVAARSEFSASRAESISTLYQAPPQPEVIAPAEVEPAPPPPPPAPVETPRVVVRSRIANVNITFYDCANQGFCGNMYNGKRVYEGAAACSWNLAIGTKFRIIGDPTGRIYSCDDRGLLSNTWVDIFFYYPSEGYRWQSSVGRYGTIEIVSLP